MTNILHIVAHLGGGTGTVINNYLEEVKDNKEFSHTVLCLDNSEVAPPKNITFLNSCSLYNLQPLIHHSDIVILHWWNHPTIFNVLCNMPFPPCRLIIWSHVSGLFAPYIYSQKLIEFSDRFLFTSPVSYGADEIKKLPDILKEKLDVIWSTGGTKKVIKKKHEGLTIGYIGTVEYSKMHSNFISMCEKINIPDVRFVICGGNDQEKIFQQATQKEKFLFTGKVPNVLSKHLPYFDIFGYPLQPHHFGTCEQVLGEAMSAGVVPVVMNNPAERCIINNHETGIIANTEEEYIREIEYLYYHPLYRNKLATQAMSFAKEKYSMDKMIRSWEQEFDEILKKSKTKKHWNGRHRFDSFGAYTFIESLGAYGKAFELSIFGGIESVRNKVDQDIKKMFDTNPQWKSSNKGSVLQYLKFFPNDKYLQKWGELIEHKN